MGECRTVIHSLALERLGVEARTSKTRRVLMFAKLFPPCNCWPTASQRAYGLARGLSELGWTPVVVTEGLRGPGCTCGAREVPNESESDQGVELIRVDLHGRRASGPLVKLSRFATGAADDWTAQARRAAKHYLETRPVDLVWTTAAPISSLRLGRYFQRARSIPWVAELRDGIWRQSVMTVQGEGPKAWLLRRRASLLARSLQDADAIVHVWPQDARGDAKMIRRPSDIIPSAFDEVAWRSIHSSPAHSTRESDVLSVLFTGAVYPGGPGYSIFFEGARAYGRTLQGLARPIQVVYLGPSFEGFRAEAQRSGMADAVIDRGIVSLARSREAMREADALLLVTTRDGLAGSPGGKLYEYLAASTPVLAVPGTDEYAADVLRRTGRGFSAPGADDVCAALLKVASASLGALPFPSPELNEFTWEARSRLLSDVFERCLGRVTQPARTS
jgi:glycosyltransferase involved in cell wall biosynthesis